MVAAILLVGRAFGVLFPLAPGIWTVIALLTAAGTLAVGLFVAAVAPNRPGAAASGRSCSSR